MTAKEHTEHIEHTDKDFDVRVVEQYLRDGDISRKEYEAYLKKLPDDEANAEYVVVFEEPPLEEPTPQLTDALTFT